MKNRIPLYAVKIYDPAPLGLICRLGDYEPSSGGKHVNDSASRCVKNLHRFDVIAKLKMVGQISICVAVHTQPECCPGKIYGLGEYGVMRNYFDFNFNFRLGVLLRQRRRYYHMSMVVAKNPQVLVGKYYR